MDQELLRSFRNKINDKGLILHIFRNQCGKNKWSVICSAMDWIEVSLEGIDISQLSRNNDNQASIRMITYISCIDILWEAVQQLHRVLFNTSSIPFQNDSSIFKQHVSDNIYFKTIRACFAAHPINLKEVFHDDHGEERWFASWSGGSFSRKDFSVILYSNKPNKENRFFDVSFIDLYAFAEKRYNYLKVLATQIDDIVTRHLDSFRNIQIENVPDVLSDIELLIMENKQRFNNDYYDYELRKIKRVFEVDEMTSMKNLNLMREYKNALTVELGEIKDNLQNMRLEDLIYQVNDDIPMIIQYPFSKLFDAVWQDEQCYLFDYVVEELNKCFNGLIDINISMSQEEVYVLACAGAYKINKGYEE